eukprot:403333442
MPSHQTLYNIDNDRILEFVIPKDLRQGIVNNAKESHRFKFTQVFDQDSTQQEVFERVAQPVIQNCLDGYNGTIFAYGQTGSGKTYSMSGGDTWNQRGIVPRVFTYLFEEIRQRTEQNYMDYNIYVSYFEIYNENGYDLLDRKHAEMQFDKWNKISLYEDNNANLHLKNLTIHSCQSEQDAIDLLMMGNFIRQVSATPMNPASSRSHCIFTIAIESKDLSTDIIRTSKLHLVDLAGSERVYKSDPDSQIKTEAKYINRSLSYLEQVIIALHEKAKGTRVHVPYRNSMMTSILRDSLGGNCKTVMIANMSPDIENEEESISTARFAQRCAKLVNELRVNEVLDLNTMVQRLETENYNLKVTVQKQEDIIKQQQQTLVSQQSQSILATPLYKQNSCRTQIDTPQKSSEYQLEIGGLDSEQTLINSSNKDTQSNLNHNQSFSNTINNQNQNQLSFLERDLTQEEIEECERAALQYVKNDSFEIELHNLNEVNEYFRIFKDEIMKKEQRYQREINDLKMQVNMLKIKVENGGPVNDRRQSTENSRVHKPFSQSQQQYNENITVLTCQKLPCMQFDSSACSLDLKQLTGYQEIAQIIKQPSSNVLRDFNQSRTDVPESPQKYSSSGYTSECNVNLDLENKITQLINQKKASLIAPPNQTFGKVTKNFGNSSLLLNSSHILNSSIVNSHNNNSISMVRNNDCSGPIGPQLQFTNTGAINSSTSIQRQI